MAKSRKDPKRARKLIKYKNKYKRRNMEKTTQQLPPVTQYPVWNANDKIEVNGAEWEAIGQLLQSAESAIAAYHAVMNKNVLNGTIRMKFQKLNEAGTEYVDMAPEEDAKHQAEFQGMLKQAKELATKAVAKAQADELAETQKDLPRIDSLTDNPLDVTGEAKVIAI